MDVAEVESFECFVENLSFKCVWQQPDENLQIINQFMEEININDTNEYGDCSPSDISALLSSSFPSGPADAIEEHSNDLSLASTLLTIISSTPIARGPNALYIFKLFGDTSPIMCPRRRDKLYRTEKFQRKRLQMNFESDKETEKNKKQKCE